VLCCSSQVRKKEAGVVEYCKICKRIVIMKYGLES
jgi:hypothetical protein